MISFALEDLRDKNSDLYKHVYLRYYDEKSVNKDAVIIAGDVYDKGNPSAEAFSVFDEFLYNLSKRNLKVFVISGNHDSAEKIAYAGRIMNARGVYMSPVFEGDINPITLSDEYGDVNFYMIPFVKPVHVRKAYPDEQITSYTDAMKTIISHR